MNLPHKPLFRLEPLLEEQARTICSWSYPEPYATYNWKPWEELLAGEEEFADPYIRETQYRAVVLPDGELCGFAQLFPIVGTTRLGLGLRPDLCGRGLGEDFVRAIAEEARRLAPENEIDLEVLTWNTRAVRTYERAGFRRTDTYERMTPSGMAEFHCMVWEEKPAGRLHASLHQPLKRIADTLNRHGVDWGLGGSALLALHGLADEPPADLDLLVNTVHAEQAHGLLAGVGAYRELAPKEPFCTLYFYRCEVNGTGVDLMGLFGIRHAEGTYRLDWNAGRQEGSTAIQGVRIPLSSLEDWYILYSLIPGKRQKAARIERHWLEAGGCTGELLQEALHRELPSALRTRIGELLDGHG